MSATVLESHVESTERIQPHQANNYSNAHGGEVVKLMDELAAISAMRIAHETCVTANIGSVDFTNPIPVGNVAELQAYVYNTGNTSLDVRVVVDSRDPREGTPQETTSACFTMVAIGEDGSPMEVPDISAETERGEKLIEEAAYC
jgi:acyl-CoA hydrolase